MRVRNKYRKSTAFPCNVGSRCSISTVVWSLVGFLLLLQLYSLVSRRNEVSRDITLRMSRHPLVRELEQVEEENIQIPPPRGKRSPRAAKRRPKRTTTLVDEFLDEFLPEPRSLLRVRSTILCLTEHITTEELMLVCYFSDVG